MRTVRIIGIFVPCPVNIEGFTFSEDAIICFIEIAFTVFTGSFLLIGPFPTDASG